MWLRKVLKSFRNEDVISNQEPLCLGRLMSCFCVYCHCPPGMELLGQSGFKSGGCAPESSSVTRFLSFPKCSSLQGQSGWWTCLDRDGQASLGAARSHVKIWPPGGIGGLAREGQDAPLPGLAQGGCPLVDDLSYGPGALIWLVSSLACLRNP